jgi:hypothetical protein
MLGKTGNKPPFWQQNWKNFTDLKKVGVKVSQTSEFYKTRRKLSFYFMTDQAGERIAFYPFVRYRLKVRYRHNNTEILTIVYK